MTEKVGLELTFDARQAQRELDKTRQSALTLGGGLEKVDRASMMAAKGIGAMGPALGAVSRSSSEALRGLGDIAGLLGAGGLFGVALGAATLAFTKLYEESTKFDRAMATSFRALRDAANTDLKGVEDRLISLKKELADFGKTGSEVRRLDALSAVLKTESDIREAQKAQLSIQEASKAALIAFGEEKRKNGKIDKEALRQTSEQLQANMQVARERERAAREALPKLEETLRVVEEIIKREKEAKGPGAAASPAAVGARGTASAREIEIPALGYGDDSALPDAAFGGGFGPSEEALAALADARLAVQQAEAAQSVRIARDAHDKIVKAAEVAAEAQKRALEDVEAAYSNVYGSAPSIGVNALFGATQDFIGRSIAANGDLERAKLGDSMQAVKTAEKAKELAFQQSTAAFLESTGSQLVGVGTKAIFEGAAISANPFTPGAGLPLVGVGIAAVAAGISMGAGGAAMADNAQTQLAKAGLAGAKIDQAKADREKGVGTGPGGFGRASGGNGSYGQTVQVINVYGVSGPQAEDRARMTARDLWLANRRGMNR